MTGSSLHAAAQQRHAGDGQQRHLPLQPLGDGSDPEVVLRDCADDHVHMRRVLCELREAVLEQVGKDQTDRLRHELADALTQYR